MSRDAEETEAKLREIVEMILRQDKITDQMELIVDTRRLYKANPQAFEQAAENLKKTGFSVISNAVDIALRIAKGENGLESRRRLKVSCTSPKKPILSVTFL